MVDFQPNSYLRNDIAHSWGQSLCEIKSDLFDNLAIATLSAISRYILPCYNGNKSCYKNEFYDIGKRSSSYSGCCPCFMTAGWFACCVFVLVKIRNGFVWIIYHVFVHVYLSIITGIGWNWDNEISAPASVLNTDGWEWNKGPVTRKMLSFDDVIMLSDLTDGRGPCIDQGRLLTLMLSVGLFTAT